MSMFDKIKSLFVIEEEGDSPKPKANKPTAKVEQKESSNIPTPKNNTVNVESASTPPPIPSAEKAKAEQKYMNTLLKAIENNNKEGFDYLEYKESLKAMSKFQPDEATRYQSAYAMASTMGVTTEKLVSSAGEYVAVLDSEEKKFQAALEAKAKQRLQGGGQELTNLQNAIKTKKEQIKKLEAEIAQHQKQYDETKTSLESVTNMINHTKESFTASYRKIRKMMTDDIEKMKHYLK